jgi:hypothetical protein
MSFTVDFGNIRETDEEGRKWLNGVQYWVGSYMMAIGMDEITEKNYLEVYARLRMLDTSILALGNDGDGEPWMNIDMLQRLIGAKFWGRHINVESRAKFSSRMLRGTINATEKKVAKESKEVA